MVGRLLRQKIFPPKVDFINQSPLYTPMVISELVQVLKHPFPLKSPHPFPFRKLRMIYHLEEDGPFIKRNGPFTGHLPSRFAIHETGIFASYFTIKIKKNGSLWDRLPHSSRREWGTIYLVNYSCRYICQSHESYMSFSKIPSPIASMYGIFTYIYHKKAPNVGKYTIHGCYGSWNRGRNSARTERNDSPGYRWHWPRPRPNLGRWGKVVWVGNGTFQQVFFCIIIVW